MMGFKKACDEAYEEGVEVGCEQAEQTQTEKVCAEKGQAEKEGSE